MQIFLLIMLSVSAAGSSYLLDSTLTANVTNIQQELSMLQKEMHNNKAALDLLNQAFNWEVASKNKLEQDLRNLTSDYNALKARNEVLEKQFVNFTKVSNNRFVSNEAKIASITADIVSDRANMSTIQAKVTRNQANIAMNHADLSISRAEIATSKADIQANRVNISGNLAEVLRNRADISINQANLSKHQADISKNQMDAATNRAGISKNGADIATNRAGVSKNQADIATNQASVSKNRADVVANQAGISKNRADISTNQAGVAYNRAEIASQSGTVSSNHADILLLKQKAGYQIGFSAQGNTRDSSSVLKFTNVKTNVGYRYSSSTGKFTCNHPGLYYFSLSLIKTREPHSIADMVFCYIRKDGVNMIYTKIDPRDDDTDNGSYETSAFLVVHLSNGETVDIGGCSDASSIDMYSSFTGFLLKAD